LHLARTRVWRNCETGGLLAAERSSERHWSSYMPVQAVKTRCTGRKSHLGQANIWPHSVGIPARSRRLALSPTHPPIRAPASPRSERSLHAAPSPSRRSSSSSSPRAVPRCSLRHPSAPPPHTHQTGIVIRSQYGGRISHIHRTPSRFVVDDSHGSSRRARPETAESLKIFR
jgi:hypothetical protein